MGKVFLDDTLTEIVRLRELAPDWDSYGADPIDPDAVWGAQQFIQEVYGHSLSTGVDFIPPEVGPTPDQGVALIWPNRGRGEVEARFSPRGNHYVVVLGRKPVRQGEIDPGFLKILVDQYLRP